MSQGIPQVAPPTMSSAEYRGIERAQGKQTESCGDGEELKVALVERDDGRQVQEMSSSARMEIDGGM